MKFVSFNSGRDTVTAFAYIWSLDKAYENDVTLREQSLLSILNFFHTLIEDSDLSIQVIWGL